MAAIAAIGKVVAQPPQRGAGLAAATTQAVTRALLHGGLRDVVLNVREDHLAAVTAFRRAGFSPHPPSRERQVTLR